MGTTSALSTLSLTSGWTRHCLGSCVQVLPRALPPSGSLWCPSCTEGEPQPSPNQHWVHPQPHLLHTAFPSSWITSWVKGREQCRMGCGTPSCSQGLISTLGLCLGFCPAGAVEELRVGQLGLTAGKPPRSPVQAPSSRVGHGSSGRLLRAGFGPVLLPGLSEQRPGPRQLGPPLRPAGHSEPKRFCAEDPH